jgi:ATP-dependent Clp protease protease subunit
MPPPPIPFVIDGSGREDRVIDIYSRLMKDRIIFMLGEVNTNSANLVVAQMLHLNAENPDADIHLYINSPGGSVTAGMSIYDVMHYIHCDVATYCIGICASMGATLLAAGTKGKRNILPHGEVMIHQVLGGIGGQATDIKIQTEHLLRTKNTMNKILADLTGQPLERIQKDTDRDNFMTATQAKEYGLVDNIVERMPRRLA